MEAVVEAVVAEAACTKSMESTASLLSNLNNWRSIFDPPYRLTRPDFVHHFSPRKPVL